MSFSRTSALVLLSALVTALVVGGGLFLLASERASDVAQLEAESAAAAQRQNIPTLEHATDSTSLRGTHDTTTHVDQKRVAARTASALPPGDRPLVVRFLDRMTREDLGVFPVAVEPVQLVEGDLDHWLALYPHGRHLEELIDPNFERVPGEQVQFVTPAPNGVLPVQPGLYRIAVLSSEEVAFHESCVPEDLFEYEEVLMVGRASEVTFEGVPLCRLSFDIVDEEGSVRDDLELDYHSEFYVGDGIHDALERQPIRTGPGRYEWWIYPGRDTSIVAKDADHRGQLDPEIPHGVRAATDTLVVRSLHDKVGALRVSLKPSSSKDVQHLEFLVRSASRSYRSEWLPLKLAETRLEGLRAGYFKVLVRERWPDGFVLLRRTINTRVQVGKDTQVVVHMDGPDELYVMGRVFGANHVLIAAFPADVRPGMEPLGVHNVRRTESGFGSFRIKVPVPGRYRLGYAPGGSRGNIASYSLFDGEFEVRRGEWTPVRVDVPSTRLDVQLTWPADRQPTKTLSVQVQRVGGPVGSKITRRTRSQPVSLEGLAPAEYEVWAEGYAQGGKIESERLRVTLEDEASVTLDLVPAEQGR